MEPAEIDVYDFHFMSMTLDYERAMKEKRAPWNWPVTATLGLTFLAAITVVPWYGITQGFSGWAWLFFGFLIVLGAALLPIILFAGRENRRRTRYAVTDRRASEFS